MKILLLICMIPFYGITQTHLKNQRFIDIGIGTFDGLKPSNYALFAGFGKYNKKINANGFEISYARKLAYLQSNSNQKLNETVPIQHFILSYKRGLNLIYNFNNTASIAVNGRINIGYESINNSTNVLNDFKINSQSDYILGIGFGPEIQLFGLNFGINTNLNFISKYQKFTTFPFIKYRIHL